jgi:lysyl-tRNA synthetase class 2
VTSDWRPSAALETLQQRAVLLAAVREFFAQRGVLEVDTPILMPTTATDIYIDSYRVDSAASFLQTSPEFALKRLLAAGCGSIYQFGKVFRREAPSKRHNHEFTLCEWYRVGMKLEQLMDEVEALVQAVFAAADSQRTAAVKIERLSYRALFETHFAIDPHRVSLDELAASSSKHLISLPPIFRAPTICSCCSVTVSNPHCQMPVLFLTIRLRRRRLRASRTMRLGSQWRDASNYF